jgi:uncharacterized protein
MAAKFELFKDKGGDFRFHLKAANGEIIASGQGYKSKATAEKGIESIKTNAPAAASSTTPPSTISFNPSRLGFYSRFCRPAAESSWVGYGTSVRGPVLVVSDASVRADSMQAVYYRKVLVDQRAELAAELAKAHQMLARCLEHGDLFAIKRTQREIRVIGSVVP